VLKKQGFRAEAFCRLAAAVLVSQNLSPPENNSAPSPLGLTLL